MTVLLGRRFSNSLVSSFKLPHQLYKLRYVVTEYATIHSFSIIELFNTHTARTIAKSSHRKVLRIVVVVNQASLALGYVIG